MHNALFATPQPNSVVHGIDYHQGTSVSGSNEDRSFSTSAMSLSCKPHRTPHMHVETWRHPQNHKYIMYCTVIRGDQATATDTMHKKFGEVRRCDFWDTQADRDTHTHTNHNILRLSQGLNNKGLFAPSMVSRYIFSPTDLWGMNSVLWCCWLGIRPVKTEWWDTGVVICLQRGANDLHMVQLMP